MLHYNGNYYDTSAEVNSGSIKRFSCNLFGSRQWKVADVVWLNLGLTVKQNPKKTSGIIKGSVMYAADAVNVLQLHMSKKSFVAQCIPTLQLDNRCSAYFQSKQIFSLQAASASNVSVLGSCISSWPLRVFPFLLSKSFSVKSAATILQPHSVSSHFIVTINSLSG